MQDVKHFVQQTLTKEGQTYKILGSALKDKSLFAGKKNYEEKLSQEIMRRNYHRKL